MTSLSARFSLSVYKLYMLIRVPIIFVYLSYSCVYHIRVSIIYECLSYPSVYHIHIAGAITLNYFKIIKYKCGTVRLYII